MKILVLLLSLVAVPVSAQTVCRVEPLHDDCPPGAVRNPPVSPLDEAYMEAAVRASFRGLFGREPSMVDGAGKDDGCYYVRASNHYGPSGDGQCHAGWSGYWESWLQNGHGDLALVQTPARFLPSPISPVPNPEPPPAPLPPSFCDEACFSRALAPLLAELHATHVDVTATRVAVEAVKGDTNWLVSGIKNVIEWGWKTGAIPAIASYFATKQVVR